MKLNIMGREFLLIRDIILEKTGIYLGENKRYLVETRLSALAVEYKCRNFSEFYLKLKEAPRTGELITKLVDAITTNETLWFRDTYPFKVLENKLLNELKENVFDKGKEIKIWSAACSTGQEPYSIAMTILEFNEKFESDPPFYNSVDILATDISKRILGLAIEGTYDEIAMGRGLPEYYKEKYFTQKNNSWEIDPLIKSLVTFKNFNLKEPFGGLIGPFDIIFIRNVMIYFADDFKKELLFYLKRVLKPRGYIILGTGENIMGYSEDFDACHYEGAVFFQCKT